MNSSEIRDSFLKFFQSKEHHIVPSAPIVVKNDPTLMFTNAGMNQFKDLFLGISPVKYPRIADTQKCLRVSGKHNDLEEVGHDTYHHTMFEMLGNWSFGDYFKEEAIAWAWEYLTEVLKIDKECLYVTIFGGDQKENLEIDQEAYDIWAKYIDKNRILSGSKKDNFWEMGDTGPCGPCSEIHVDIRNVSEKNKIDGKALVNTGHPQVIEIWNNVFIQFNRKANGQLELLPAKHVDTGMGFERLCMVVQGKQSNYDTDIFQDIISEITTLTGIKYGSDPSCDIAMRVVADHLRAVSFAIADGQVPSNNKAGYVIRRILRRAVRYSYTYLNQDQPFLYRLVNALVKKMGDTFPEIVAQEKLVTQVIREEEQSFLRTLSTGIKLLEELTDKAKKQNKTEIFGSDAFVLYDTYGFPLDLTELILREQNFTLDRLGFEQEMEQQKNRSRTNAAQETDDWVQVSSTSGKGFIGYDSIETKTRVVQYRKVSGKGQSFFHLVLSDTPFYAESGGQVGDTGWLINQEQKISIINTIKENNQWIHIVDSLPENIDGDFNAQVDYKRRQSIMANHSATHLLHQALRKYLGTHVEQKGSLVHPDYLRFDFSHFQKLSATELQQVEEFVNDRIRENLELNENRSMSYPDALQSGAMALFGEKYGETVRVIKFGDSVELCGGTHVKATGQISYFKILSESAIAAGIRRIEAVTGAGFAEYLNKQLETFEKLKSVLNNPQDLVKSVDQLILENQTLAKKIESFEKDKIISLKTNLLANSKEVNGIRFVASKVDIGSAEMLKDLAFQLKSSSELFFGVLGAAIDQKANLAVVISDELVQKNKLNASSIVRELAKEIDGGGGGQPFFASAGGKNITGIDRAIARASEFI